MIDPTRKIRIPRWLLVLAAMVPLLLMLMGPPPSALPQQVGPVASVVTVDDANAARATISDVLVAYLDFTEIIFKKCHQAAITYMAICRSDPQDELIKVDCTRGYKQTLLKPILLANQILCHGTYVLQFEEKNSQGARCGGKEYYKKLPGRVVRQKLKSDWESLGECEKYIIPESA